MKQIFRLQLVAKDGTLVDSFNISNGGNGESGEFDISKPIARAWVMDDIVSAVETYENRNGS